MTDYQPMTEPEQRDYAEAVIYQAVNEIEAWDVIIGCPRRPDQTDTQAVLDLIKRADVSVSFD